MELPLKKRHWSQMTSRKPNDEMNQNNYNWIIRYKDADWSLKLLGVKHKSYHHVNLFPVNYNFFTKSGGSLGDALIDDSKKYLLKNYITDFNLQKDKNLLKEFSFMVIGFCQKWVDLYEQKEDKRHMRNRVFICTCLNCCSTYSLK